MRTKTFFKILSVFVATSLAGCDVKDPIYNTPHPEHGTVTLTTHWSGIGEGLTAPASYTVAVTPVAGGATGGYTATVNGTTATLDHLFAPGMYRAQVCNTPQHITITGSVASVEAATPPTGQTGTFVHNAPGWLFTSAIDVAIEADAEHAYTAVMQQQVRQLTLIIEPTGGTVDKIERIEGYLSGAAATLDFAAATPDITTGTHATPSNVELQFSEITDGANAGKYAATVRLLGTAGTQQQLTASIAFTDGGPAAATLTSDLTTALAAFNADKRTPLTLGGTIVETPTGAGFSATITDWTPVHSGPVTAD
ncbi:FimB/Mfa2 family fimbrial subunit [Bacteroides thetaiotaomicron]|uniref:FimB/Mfa2 family fimbrial subunit n=1 Tax=Bacteroides thetaiotaomicron TaxID=818 RepID=UPI00356B0531